MKHQFGPDEMSWLNFALGIYANAAIQAREYGRAKLASRVRYKFTPNASLVHLSGKERELIATIVGLAADSVTPMTGDGPMLKGILTKLGGGNHDDSNQTDTRKS